MILICASIHICAKSISRRGSNFVGHCHPTNYDNYSDSDSSQRHRTIEPNHLLQLMFTRLSTPSSWLQDKVNFRWHYQNNEIRVTNCGCDAFANIICTFSKINYLPRLCAKYKVLCAFHYWFTQQKTFVVTSLSHFHCWKTSLEAQKFILLGVNTTRL